MKSLATYLLLGASVFLAAHAASPQSKLPDSNKRKQIVVFVESTKSGLVFQLKSGEYKKGDANYMLAELKLQEGGDCQIIPIIDDRSPLSAVTDVSEMAINAGFKDIRPFVYWHKTGRMAQIEFGPPIKATTDPQKIAQRETKEARVQHFIETK